MTVSLGFGSVRCGGVGAAPPLATPPVFFAVLWPAFRPGNRGVLTPFGVLADSWQVAFMIRFRCKLQPLMRPGGGLDEEPPVHRWRPPVRATTAPCPFSERPCILYLLTLSIRYSSRFVKSPKPSLPLRFQMPCKIIKVIKATTAHVDNLTPAGRPTAHCPLPNHQTQPTRFRPGGRPTTARR